MSSERLTNIDLLRERLRRVSIERVYGTDWVDYTLLMADLKAEIERAEQFPETQTEFESHIEERLYHAITRGPNHLLERPECQFQVGPYRIDLAFPRGKLGIECDGAWFHSSLKQKASDRAREKYLKREGWTIIRFSGAAIYRAPEKCVDQIHRRLLQTRYWEKPESRE